MAPKKWKEIKDDPKWEELREEDVQNRIEVKPKPFKPLNNKQTLAIKVLEDNQIIVLSGESGSGKSHIALAYATQLFKEGKIKKILLSRPLVECGGEKMGYFPGSEMEKMSGWARPSTDLLKNFYPDPKELGELIKIGAIEITSLSMMRGLTYNDTIMVLEEGQNTNKIQLKMWLSRIGQNTKCIICADLEQSDLINCREPPLVDVIRRIRNIQGVGIVKFDVEDIVRSGIVQDVIRALKEDNY